MPDCIDTAFVDISNGANSKFTIDVIYRPPAGDLSIFNVYYCNLLDEISRCKSKCYIAGDNNINLLNSDSHLKTERFLNNVFSHYQFPRSTRFCPTDRKSVV